MRVVYCYRSGELHVGRRCPSGALELARGPGRVLNRIILALARQDYNRMTFLLVPGLPEASNDVAALVAARRFSDQILKELAACTTSEGELL